MTPTPGFSTLREFNPASRFPIAALSISEQSPVRLKLGLSPRSYHPGYLFWLAILSVTMTDAFGRAVSFSGAGIWPGLTSQHVNANKVPNNAKRQEFLSSNVDLRITVAVVV